MSQMDMLGLLDGSTEQQERRAALRREHDERRRVRPDTGKVLEPGWTWCGRCGQTVREFELVNNHDLAYGGCPVEFDPTWSKYDPAPGFRGVANYPGGSHLTAEDLADRFDRQYFPDCAECGCPWGLHKLSQGICIAYCGCPEYTAP
ncbi:hypothetical protein [Mycolicibacterium sp.]|uniref:hypothetical protein n=1 Tax=Mycolicibacterium sp. TaxID=2320850 RepID=UPI0037C68C01